MKQGSKSSSSGLSPSGCRPGVFAPGNEADGEDNPSTGGLGRQQAAGFTLKELLIVISIIAILVGLAYLRYNRSVRPQAEGITCTHNLKNLHVVLNNHLIQKGHWPQPPPGALADQDKLMGWWVEYFAQPPFNIPEETWMCPTYKRLSAGREGWKPKSSYVVTRFPPHPFAPFQHPKLQWITEICDCHGDGALVLYLDGSVKPHPLLNFKPDSRK